MGSWVVRRASSITGHHSIKTLRPPGAAGYALVLPISRVTVQTVAAEAIMLQLKDSRLDGQVLPRLRCRGYIPTRLHSPTHKGQRNQLLSQQLLQLITSTKYYSSLICNSDRFHRKGGSTNVIINFLCCSSHVPVISQFHVTLASLLHLSYTYMDGELSQTCPYI